MESLPLIICCEKCGKRLKIEDVSAGRAILVNIQPEHICQPLFSDLKSLEAGLSYRP